MTPRIEVSESVAAELRRRTRGDDSLDEVLQRLLRTEGLAGAGSWDHETAVRAREAIARSRESFERRSYR